MSKSTFVMTEEDEAFLHENGWEKAAGSCGFNMHDRDIYGKYIVREQGKRKFSGGAYKPRTRTKHHPKSTM